jgi:diaminohydroxyphosphoribosylaminopyrimidine deaminase / 5-amino-6-(5-phosphoribosylamino)uracil reductase
MGGSADHAPDDVAWMSRAVALAERARDLAGDNPHVGCVLVRDGRWLADGWTQPPGGMHAEAMALAAAEDARGATAYVTLEPCAHHGRTPPCADALAAAGVARVVVGLVDPHPVAAGGATVLAGAGVEVTLGVLDGWVRAQLAAWLTVVTRGRPHVTLKLAQTVDGALANPDGRWITTPASRRAVHRMRGRSDAVLVGSGTVLADDPRLDVRDVALRHAQPRAVILDARGRTPVGARVVRPGTIIVTASSPPDWRSAVAAAGVQVVAVPSSSPSGGVDLPAALGRLLTEFGIRRVLAEPGPTLAGALLGADLVDRVVRHVATSVRGADGQSRIVAVLAPTATWPITQQVVRGPDREVVSDRPAG